MTWFVITYGRFYMINHTAHFSTWKGTNFKTEFINNFFSWGDDTHIVFDHTVFQNINIFLFFSVGTSFSLFLVFLLYSYLLFSHRFSFLSWCYSLNGTLAFCSFCWYFENLTFQWYFCFVGFWFYLNFCLILC